MIRIESLLFSVEAIMPTLLVVFLGWLLRRSRIVSGEFAAQLNDFVFRVGFPFCLGLELYRVDLSEMFDLGLCLYASTAMTVVMILAMLIYPCLTSERPKLYSMVQASFRGNYLLYAALITEAFGSISLACAMMMCIFLTPLINLYASMLGGIYSNGKRDAGSVKKILVSTLSSPLMIGVLVGLALNLLNIHVPKMVVSAAEKIGSCAMPLGMITLGAQLVIPERGAQRKLLVTATLYRNFLVPILILGGAVLLGYRGFRLAALLPLAASPAAVSSYVVAAKFGGDRELAGQLVMATTVLSIVSLLIVLYVFNTFGLA